ncbi:MAG: metallophosphoesterase [Fimbriimonas sp.]
MNKLRILQTNDFHGSLGGAALATLASVRPEHDLYFDSGDAIKAGNLAIPLREEAVWGHLAQLECTASVLGNRETHVLESAFRAKIQGARHPLMCGNLQRRDGSFPLARTLLLESQGYRIGVLAVMVPMVTAKMVTQAASAYLWTAPIPTALELAQELRPQCDVLIALTHIGFAQDQLLAEACPQIDIILGGHSHTVLQEPVRVGHTTICQGGSHARFYGSYEWDGQALSGGLQPLNPS